MRTVFILGAGASLHAGAPLMANFLKTSREIPCRRDKQREPLDKAQKNQFDLVVQGVDVLTGLVERGKIDFKVGDLEAVFTAFEMAKLLGLDKAEPLGRPELIDAMRVVIAVTLEETVRYPVRQGMLLPAGDGTYVTFAGWIHDLVRAQSDAAEHVAVISFNYDLALDRALTAIELTVDYGLTDEDVAHAPSAKRVALLKLHGSAHWSSCPSCQEIVRQPIGEAFKQSTEHFRKSKQYSGDYPIRASQVLAKLTCQPCRQAVSGLPFIVPPTMQKLGEQHRLRPVWQRAANELSEADYIVIIGYSWPEGDQFFRQLLALSAGGDHRARKVIVVNPCMDAAQRIGSLFRPEWRLPAILDRFSPKSLQAVAGALNLPFHEKLLVRLNIPSR